MQHFIENSAGLTIRELIPIIQDRIMNKTSYFGIKTLKNPFDYWIYKEIIFKNKPDIIIEIGNHSGGSTLALAHLCELIGKGRIIGIDIDHERVPVYVKKNKRIKFITGDACDVFYQVKMKVKKNDKVLIIEDSSHTYENTLNILRLYSELIKPGGYFIIEDGICHHGFDHGPKPGPYEAVEAFLDKNPDFYLDREKESFLITWNPKGYLKRKGNTVIKRSLLKKAFNKLKRTLTLV